MVYDQFSAWHDQEHVETFDYISRLPNILIKYHYNRLNEIKLLKKNIRIIDGKKIYEIGCATGELYRYFIKNFKRSDYFGFDVSAPAIDRAKSKYPKNKFILLSPDEIYNIKSNYGQPDLVWSRDVILHQSEPYKFIKFLIDLPTEAAVLKLRTRDIGNTIFDTENSCQLHWDKYWAPYIVLNTEELINEISLNKEVSKIFISRWYQVLGGHNLRYLPKELYYKHAKTAETALLVLKGKRMNDKVDVIYDDREEESYNYFYRTLRKIYTYFNK